MKKIFLLFLLYICQFHVRGADTTIIASHQNVIIQTEPSIGYTEYPQWAEFPASATQYRKVIMALKFECAPGLKCGAYDYLNHIYIGKKGGQSGTALNYEIARHVTPAGDDKWTSAVEPWQHTWYFDVTDFSMLLHDSVEIVYKHTGYEPKEDRGWQINLSFICVEGAPVREPISVQKLWSGEYQMGNPADPIESHLEPVSKTLNAATQNVRLRMINTGHGSDSAEGCMTFCKKFRTIKWDNAEVSKKDIWRGDCGANAVYPQNGSWVYNRAGWCPGSSVRYDDVDIQNVTSGAHNIDMDMQTYTAYKNFGKIITTAYLIEYKNPVSSTDAELVTIISPSIEKEYQKVNPICNGAVIVIRNNGKDVLTSLTVEYGTGASTALYEWTGNLAFLESDTVTLTSPVDWTSGNGTFIATLKNPNGKADEFSGDNVQVSRYAPPEAMPKRIVLYFVTNKDASENSYQVVNASTGKIHFERSGFENDQTYQDTLNLTPGDCYYLRFSDEGPSRSLTGINQDGLYFNNDYYNEIEGIGTLQIRTATSGFPLKNITGATSGPYGSHGGNFGAFYQYYFMCEFGLSTQTLQGVKTQVDIYPNPASDRVNINYVMKGDNGNITLSDIKGQFLYAARVNGSTGIHSVNLATYPAGVYMLKFTCGDETIVKRIVKR